MTTPDTNRTTARTGKGRRGHNEGTIKLRADGRWEARVTLPDGRRKSFYAETRKEVAERMTAALRDVQQGIPVPTGRQTVGDFLTRWLAETCKPEVSPATHHSYRGMIERHVLPALGKVALDKLTPQHVQKLQTDMLARGLSPRTVTYTRAVLRRALGQAVKWGLIARNPAALVDPPKQERRDPVFLTPDDARRLMEVIKGDQLEPLVLLTLTTGLRRGEVLSLRWRDVDLDTGVVAVEGQYQKWDGVWQWRPLKTAHSRRTLTLPSFVVAALRAHKAQQNSDRLLLGSAWTDFGLVFASTAGTPRDGTNLDHQWARLLAKHGLPPMPFHGLRHSAATLLLARGLTLGQIQKILGHANVNLTANLYAHHTREIADRAAAEMQALFGS